MCDSGIKDFYRQFMTINPEKTAFYQCVFPKLEENNKKVPSKPLPVIGITPNILGILESL